MHNPNQEPWRPAASLEMLRLRARVLACVRRFLDERDYWEVETPVLSHDVVVDAHLEPFRVPGRAGLEMRSTAPNPHADDLFLQTSPEFGMKRLLAAGAASIYQITRAFRQEERGRWHNPEFTMIEWYRASDTHHQQMDFVEELVVAVFQFVATERRSSELKTPPARPFSRLTYESAFEAVLGSRVLGLPGDELAALARKAGIVAPDSLDVADRDGWLNLILAEVVEPTLGFDRPAFLYDYPASQAALAKIRHEEPPVAERFELYIAGIEICNGYHELTDPAELRRRMQVQSELRARENKPQLPLENQLLKAMEAGLPHCAGVALGFDRLFALAVGATSLDEVTAFPFDRA